MTFDGIVEAISYYTGAKPAVQCLANRASYDLWQVWICLDLDFAPIDCDVIKGGLNHGCPETGRIGYPDHELIYRTGIVLHVDNYWPGRYFVREYLFLFFPRVILGVEIGFCSDLIYPRASTYRLLVTVCR